MSYFDRPCKALILQNRDELHLGKIFRGSNLKESAQLHRVSPIVYQRALKNLDFRAAEKINAIVLGGASHA